MTGDPARDLTDGSAESIPEATVARLPVYLRGLVGLAETGVATVSSVELAEMAGVNAANVRKDLSYLHAHGTRGVGYQVDHLIGEISLVLGGGVPSPVVIVGIGNLGRALLSYRGFEREGFEVVGAFDVQSGRFPKEVPIQVRSMKVMPKVIDEHLVKMAILCVPPTAAQEVTNQLIEYGVVAILNFAPIVLSVPDEVTVNNVNLAMELENLSYFINE